MVRYTAGVPIVLDKPPTGAGSGREVEVWLGPNFSTKIAAFSRWTSILGGSALNDVGSGSVTLDMTDPQLADPLYNGMDIDDVLLGGNLWRVVLDGKAQFEFIADSITYDDTSDAGVASTVTIKGKGPAQQLDNAVVLPPGFPSQTDMFWSFQNTPMMSAWLQLYVAARSRGTIPAFRPMFNSVTDSGGRIWDDTRTAASMVAPYVPDLGDTLLNILNKLTGQDTETASQLRCEWFLHPFLKLDVRPTIGVDRSASVVFYDGKDIRHRRRTIVAEDIKNYVITRDVYGGTSLARNASSCQTYGQREHFFQHELITSSSMRQTIANLLLDKQATKRTSWTVKIMADVEGKIPFKDFGVGDWISLDIYDARKQTSSKEKLRVMAITIHDTPVAQEAELILETVLDHKAKEIARKITYTLNQINKKSSTTKLTLPANRAVYNNKLQRWTYLSPNYTDYGFYGDTGAYPSTDTYDSLTADTGLVADGNGGYTTAPIQSGISVYFQTDEPTGANVGDIWIDYDAEPPVEEDPFAPIARVGNLWPEEEPDEPYDRVLDELYPNTTRGFKVWLNGHLDD